MAGMRALKIVLKVVAGLVIAPWALIGVLFIWWNVRRPPSFVTPAELKHENWIAVAAGKDLRTQHLSNTDLIRFRDSFFLVHARTKWHLEDRRGALVVQRSADARQWEEVARITVPNTDVRDPKFAVIGGRLFMYFLPNTSFDPSPKTTYWTVSDDGVSWQAPREVEGIWLPDGKGGWTLSRSWNFWRPKSRDGRTWYMLASGPLPGTSPRVSVLIRSVDGLRWEMVSPVYTAHGNGEPEMEFQDDGSIIACLRCGGLGVPGYEFGNPTANTVIAVARPPYTEWSTAHSFITRLDGSTMFSVGGRMFAAGRNHLGPRRDLGNHLATKRTAIYEVRRDRLVHLFDLPSSGDTAYTGVVVRGDDIFVSYYTPPIERDLPWIAAICFQPRTDIRISRFSGRGLLAVADAAARAAGSAPVPKGD